MFARISTFLVVVFVLAAPSPGLAVPTCAAGNVAAAPAVAADVSTALTLHPAEAAFEGADKTLVRIGTDLLNGSRGLSLPPAQSPALAEQLPGVPAAMLMGAIGFLCVSIVRDRGAWLSVIAAAMTLGHAGVHVSSPIGCRALSRNHGGFVRQSPAVLSETWCAGLLRHVLTAPAGDGHLTPPSLVKIIDRGLSSGQPAIIGAQPHWEFLTERPRSRDGHFVCFSPAFIFDSIPRGPPQST